MSDPAPYSYVLRTKVIAACGHFVVRPEESINVASRMMAPFTPHQLHVSPEIGRAFELHDVRVGAVSPTFLSVSGTSLANAELVHSWAKMIGEVQVDDDLMLCVTNVSREPMAFSAIWEGEVRFIVDPDAQPDEWSKLVDLDAVDLRLKQNYKMDLASPFDGDLNTHALVDIRRMAAELRRFRKAVVPPDAT